MEEIEEKLKDYTKATEEFMVAIREHSATIKSQLKGHDLFQAVKYLPGDDVWFVPDKKVDHENNVLSVDGLYIKARIKINEDGSDNRLEMLPNEQIEIKSGRVEAICYGNRPEERWNSKPQKKWWYRIGWEGNWISEEMIALSREDLLVRWSEQYIELRDREFHVRHAQIEGERQSKIAAARKLLEQSGGL